MSNTDPRNLHYLSNDIDRAITSLNRMNIQGTGENSSTHLRLIGLNLEDCKQSIESIAEELNIDLSLGLPKGEENENG